MKAFSTSTRLSAGKVSVNSTSSFSSSGLAAVAVVRFVVTGSTGFVVLTVTSCDALAAEVGDGVTAAEVSTGVAKGVPVDCGVGDDVSLGCGDATGVSVGVGTAVSEGCADSLGDGVGFASGVGVSIGVAVSVGFGVSVGVTAVGVVGSGDARTFTVGVALALASTTGVRTVRGRCCAAISVWP